MQTEFLILTTVEASPSAAYPMTSHSAWMYTAKALGSCSSTDVDIATTFASLTAVRASAAASWIATIGSFLTHLPPNSYSWQLVHTWRST